MSRRHYEGASRGTIHQIRPLEDDCGGSISSGLRLIERQSCRLTNIKKGSLFIWFLLIRTGLPDLSMALKKRQNQTDSHILKQLVAIRRNFAIIRT